MAIRYEDIKDDDAKPKRIVPQPAKSPKADEPEPEGDAPVALPFAKPVKTEKGRKKR